MLKQVRVFAAVEVVQVAVVAAAVVMVVKLCCWPLSRSSPITFHLHSKICCAFFSFRSIASIINSLFHVLPLVTN